MLATELCDAMPPLYPCCHYGMGRETPPSERSPTCLESPLATLTQRRLQLLGHVHLMHGYECRRPRKLWCVRHPKEVIQLEARECNGTI